MTDSAAPLGTWKMVSWKEIKTGSRRLIGYILSPLSRYKHETLHER